jgi:hypothetical protein
MEYVIARKVLLDTLDLLRPHLPSLILVGAIGNALVANAKRAGFSSIAARYGRSPRAAAGCEGREQHARGEYRTQSLKNRSMLRTIVVDQLRRHIEPDQTGSDGAPHLGQKKQGTVRAGGAGRLPGNFHIHHVA